MHIDNYGICRCPECEGEEINQVKDLLDNEDDE